MAATIAPAGPAAADGLQITPAKIDVSVQQGDRLPSIRVRNGTDRRVRVRARALRADQEISGLPRFRVSAETLEEGKGFLSVSPARFALAPGESRMVSARVTGGPVRGLGAYGVVLIDGRMTERGEGSVVTPVIRLAANVLLRYPGRASATGEITDLRAAQSGPRQIDFITRMRNRGRIHGTPAARLRIRDAKGRVVVRRPVLSGNILPGSERELPATLRKVLPAGRYVAQVRARLGRRKSTRRLPFTLVGPNELPTPDLQIVELPAPRPDAGEPFSARVRVRNDGTAPVAADGELAIGAVGGEPTIREPLSLEGLAPGDATTLDTQVPGVAEGSHELTVRFSEDDRVLAERSLVFAAGEALPWTTRLLDWLADHLLLVLGTAVLLVVAIGLFAAAKIRRLQRRLADQAP